MSLDVNSNIWEVSRTPGPGNTANVRVSFPSLFLYFRVLGLLREADLVGSVSVGEVLFQLGKVYSLGDGGDRFRLSDIPGGVEKLIMKL